jgi:hypothetical protein
MLACGHAPTQQAKKYPTNGQSGNWHNQVALREQPGRTRIEVANFSAPDLGLR